MARLAGGAVVAIVGLDGGTRLTREGYAVRHTWRDANETCIAWDAPLADFGAGRSCRRERNEVSAREGRPPGTGPPMMIAAMPLALDAAARPVRPAGMPRVTYG